MELWTAGWLEATQHRVASRGPGEVPRQSLVLFQAHDDLVLVKPLTACQLSARQPRHNCGNVAKQEQGEPERRRSSRLRKASPCHVTEDCDHRAAAVAPFTVWVRTRPRSVLKKYPATTQGTWVRRNEFKAKAALQASHW